MFQTVSRLLPEVPLILVTAIATHLVMSFAQTLMHYKLGHHPMGRKFFRNQFSGRTSAKRQQHALLLHPRVFSRRGALISYCR